MTQHISSQKNEIVIQHNHLVEAHYKLTLQEKRLVLWLASQVQKEDDEFKVHTLTIAEFAEIAKIERNGAYKELPKITERLMQKIIKIRSLDREELLQVAWLNSARYQFKKGKVILRFSSDLKPFLLQIKYKFTKANLEDLMVIRSIYAIRLYELLKQYESIGERIISLSCLREYCGIGNEKYKNYNDFKRKIIEISEREINSKTDISIKYDEIKSSRKITSIRFSINKNSNHKQTEFEKYQIEKAVIIQKELRSEKAIINQLVEYGFTDSQSKKIVKSNRQETIINAIKSVDIQVSRGKVKNAKAMLAKAIQEKWHPEKYQNKILKVSC